MNYLGHYAFNHEVSGLDPQPYFVMGVALPDLWSRLSRRRRIRWNAVRAAEPADSRSAGLRAGMLNHVAIDRRFHTLPVFIDWQRELHQRVSGDGTHPALLDFLVHIAVELTIDRVLVRETPQLADRFFDTLQQCDYGGVEERIGRIAAVNPRGLRELLRVFVGRRFLRNYARRDALLGVMRHILGLTSVRHTPPDRLLLDLLDAAHEQVDPRWIWEELSDDRRAGSPAVPGT
jgi:hypothetical protein